VFGGTHIPLWNGLGGYQTGSMESESEKYLSTQSFPMAEPMKDALGRIVEESHDDAETEYCEDFSDPTFVAVALPVSREVARQ
jgi:hypothetical protein